MFLPYLCVRASSSTPTRSLIICPIWPRECSVYLSLSASSSLSPACWMSLPPAKRKRKIKTTDNRIRCDKARRVKKHGGLIFYIFKILLRVIFTSKIKHDTIKLKKILKCQIPLIKINQLYNTHNGYNVIERGDSNPRLYPACIGIFRCGIS